MKLVWLDWQARAGDSMGVQSDNVWRIVMGVDEWGRDFTIYTYPSRANFSLRQCIALTEGGACTADKRWYKR